MTFIKHFPLTEKEKSVCILMMGYDSAAQAVEVKIREQKKYLHLMWPESETVFVLLQVTEYSVTPVVG